MAKDITLAERCGASERGTRILCDYLTVGGLLTKDNGAYALTPESAAFLDQRSRMYLGSCAQFLNHPFHHKAASDVAARDDAPQRTRVPGHRK